MTFVLAHSSSQQCFSELLLWCLLLIHLNNWIWANILHKYACLCSDIVAFSTPLWLLDTQMHPISSNQHTNHCGDTLGFLLDSCQDVFGNHSAFRWCWGIHHYYGKIGASLSWASMPSSVRQSQIISFRTRLSNIPSDCKETCKPCPWFRNCRFVICTVVMLNFVSMRSFHKPIYLLMSGFHLALSGANPERWQIEAYALVKQKTLARVQLELNLVNMSTLPWRWSIPPPYLIKKLSCSL